ncbi:LysR family transcriptional regulator [Pseudoduganella buxea]|uniref:LysR family transcriptional regulator n=1 Tax=Pseudoduganella buxea TaxID=1949069 RepID=A0A6I3SQJ3_9BURK|nr:LysR family transcriptional regulator [Pseudoduganella buxea]MTV51338.1 LysR family transcriptional regulator [Pseudoduganella buxea]GGC09487.1 LysR family transcriptional regulator [Pseudoduganella buxea]
MNWDDYRYFLAVAATGSLSAAARRLGQSHSTVLRRLDKLETVLDARLFERFQNGYVLTAAGDELLALLAPLDDGMNDVARQMSGRNAALQGTIRVTTTDTLLEALLLPALAEFRRHHPGIALQVTVDNSFLNLTRREADVAIRPSNTPPDRLAGRKLGTVRTAPYASRAYLERVEGGGPHGGDWAKHDWVAPDDALAHLAQARWLREHVPPERTALSVDSLVGMTAAVAAGLGAGMLLCLLADTRPDLVQLAPPVPALDTDVWVLTHPDLRRVNRIRTFTEFLYTRLAGQGPLA